METVWQVASPEPGEVGDTVVVEIDGKPVETRRGTRIAAVLLAQGATAFRHSPVSGKPRSAFCMMGVCFECLVEIDGCPNRQACLEYAEDSMQIRRQLCLPGGSYEA